MTEQEFNEMAAKVGAVLESYGLTQREALSYFCTEADMLAEELGILDALPELFTKMAKRRAQ